MRSKMELDHIFLFVHDEATARAMMESAGLRVNYSRTHSGQGTSNVCACLDDVYFELLWLNGSTVSAESERIGLGYRGRGLGSPIGLAWRGDAPLDCEEYAAPFLPLGFSIPFASASLDPKIPFVFQSPDGMRPAERDDDLTGRRQLPATMNLKRCTVRVPDPSLLPAFVHHFDCVDFSVGIPGIDVEIVSSMSRSIHRFSWSLDGA